MSDIYMYTEEVTACKQNLAAHRFHEHKPRTQLQSRYQTLGYKSQYSYWFYYWHTPVSLGGGGRLQVRTVRAHLNTAMTHRREELFVDTITTAANHGACCTSTNELHFLNAPFLSSSSSTQTVWVFKKLVCQLRMSCPGPNLTVVGKKRLSALIEKQGTEQEVHQ